MVRPYDVEALKQLALIGALDDYVELASGDFAGLIDTSQQTASRRLIELTSRDLIQREMGVRKQRIRVTEEGRSVLHGEHLAYQRLFSVHDAVPIHGTVATGLGEGRYYLSREGYEVQFQDTLGWKPYPGTLNLELGSAEANKLKFLRRNPTHQIHGFQAEGRTFGGVACHKATVAGQECAAIIPHRSHHTTTLELIAPVCLRDTLPCQDGDGLDVVVHLPEPAEGT